MEDQVVSIEVAKLAKEKGFDWEVRHFYYNDNELAEFQYYQMDRNYSNYTGYPEDLLYMAPTQSLLQKWLREVHDIKIFIDYQGIGSDDYEYCYIIQYEEGNAKRQYNRIKIIESLQFYPGGYINAVCNNTYEEVLEQALLKALTLIKNEN